MAQDYVKGLLSGGEVVLVDTRQHWMAAVRYALKPILLLALVGLLALVNQWLRFDGVLSIVNDIIHLLLVIAIVVAVVWLPVDLVRWYSRKYVLTNRRAMRMDGVLRKRSFDSSLEQINDIGFEQTVMGRAMGYADLTLYTASDTANETYEQLMDGLQFKKAVLDAKEGLRHGSPLMALPEGFIVRGGTNDSSMRADGRLEEAAASSGEAPSAHSVPAEVSGQHSEDTAPAEVTPAVAAPVVEAAVEPVVEAVPEPVAPPAPEPVVEAAPEPEPPPAPVVEAPPVVEAAAEPVVEAPAEPATDAWPAADSATTSGDDAPKSP